MSQEELAELADLHPTYIGQLERGEKNASIETLYKISLGLHVPIIQLLEKLDEYQQLDSKDSISSNCPSNSENFPLQAYELFSLEPIENQRKLFKILTYALMLKN